MTNVAVSIFRIFQQDFTIMRMEHSGMELIQDVLSQIILTQLWHPNKAQTKLITRQEGHSALTEATSILQASGSQSVRNCCGISHALFILMTFALGKY